mgnify:CR=1 FL=1
MSELGQASAHSGVRYPCPGHYFSREYCSPRRLAAYSYQIDEVLKAGPGRVLEIGPGNGIVSHVLRGAGLLVVTLDLDGRLRPDIVASVLHLPLAQHSFDLVLCCQVLEHLPFDQFRPVLEQLRRVTRGRVVLSLPDRRRCITAQVSAPGLGTRAVLLSLPGLRPRRHVYDGQHFWEIGKRHYSLGRVLQEMQCVGFSVVRHYRIRENPYQHVFVLEAEPASLAVNTNR